MQIFNKHDIARDAFMLKGPLKNKGYDWWWHSFTGQDVETGEDKSFFVEFFLINPGLADRVPVFGQDPENKENGRKPSYLMVKAGAWGEDHAQLHRFFAWKDIDLHSGVPYMIRADDCLAGEKLLQGSVTVSVEDAQNHPEWMSDSGSMSWNLMLHKDIAFNAGFGASKPVREAHALAMYWHAEGMKTEYEGEVTYNGRLYKVSPEKCYGYADKNWGSEFTTPWLWLSSNCLYSKKYHKQLTNSVFDIGGGRPKIYSFGLNGQLLAAFWYEGKEYDFNFSKPNLHVKTVFSFEELKDTVHWHVRQENVHAVMDTDIFCKKNEMIWANYEDPSGVKELKQLWNGGTGYGTIRLYEKHADQEVLIDEIEATHVGCEYGDK